MNTHSVIYYYDDKTDNFYSISNFCTKINVCFLECNTIELMAYLVKNIKPMFVIFDSNNITETLIEDFYNTNKKCIIYVLNKDESLTNNNPNIYYIDNIKKLETLLSNHIHYYSNIGTISNKEESLCKELIHNELDKLSFRSKLIGVKYLSEILQEILMSESIYNGRCSNMYPKIALKYNTNIGSIERSIRFCIQQTYITSQNKNLFHEISKQNKAPTVKELANYILDKVVLKLSKNQIA